MPKFPSHLLLNKYGVYHFRISIPEPLRAFFGKRELKKSLRTYDKLEAVTASQVMTLQIKQLFNLLKNYGESMADSKKRNLTNEELEKILSSKNAVHRIKGHYGGLDFEIDHDDPEEERKSLEQLIKGCFDEVSRDLCDSTQEAPTQRGKEKFISLGKLYEEFSQEKMKVGAWTDNTVKEFSRLFEVIQRILDTDNAQIVNQEMARHLKNVLSNLPPYFNQVKRFNGVPIEEIVKMNHQKKMSLKTINKYINLISGLYIWAIDQGYDVQNPFKGKSLPVHKTKQKKRLPFTQKDLETIFSAPRFSEGKFKKVHEYWVPLIALFSGARLEEICQLHVSDITQMGGIWVINITDEQDGTDAEQKSIKTSAGKRSVPLHPRLIDCGFLIYLDSLKKRKEKRLFPELKRDNRGKLSANASKRFRTFLKRINVKKEGGDGKCFHSFRHTIINHLKQKKISRELVGAIVGHKDQSVTYGVYGQDYGPEALKEIIETVDYDDVLEKVKPWT